MRFRAADGWPGGDACSVAAGAKGGGFTGLGRVIADCKSGRRENFNSGDRMKVSAVKMCVRCWQRRMVICGLRRIRPGGCGYSRTGNFTDYHCPSRCAAISNALPREGAHGTIWAGTSDGFIFRVQETNVVNELAVEAKPALSVRCLLATADGSLWIGYAGWGIGRYHDGHYSRITPGARIIWDDYVARRFFPMGRAGCG